MQPSDVAIPIWGSCRWPERPLWSRYGISRAHCAESVYCWNDTIRSPLKW